MKKNALSITREKDFAGWYQQVITEADMAEESGVRGSMIMRPWGYGIWERVQYLMDQRIKASGHENCYFPLFIPLSYFSKEAEHVDGFAKEMAVVTHHRLISDGKGGLMGRAERILLFSVGLIIGQIEPMLWIFVVLVWITAAQRFVSTYRSIE